MKNEYGIYVDYTKPILTRYGRKLIKEKTGCTCHIDLLMKEGCQCGQFQKEMMAKDGPETKEEKKAP